MDKPRTAYGTFKKLDGEPIAEKPISFYLPISYDVQIRKMLNRSKWLREVVMEALDKEKPV